MTITTPVMFPAITLPTVGLSQDERDIISQMLQTMTRYEYGGKVSLGGQALARSPFWSPPSPGKSATGAKSWKGYCFPDLGKDHMLIGEPWLEVNWVAVLARMLFYTVAPFLVLSGLLTVYEQGRRRTRSRRRPLADE